MDPQQILDREIGYDASPLDIEIRQAVLEPTFQVASQSAVISFSRWLTEQIPGADEQWQLATQMIDVVAQIPHLVRVDQLAQNLSLSVRSLQRLATQYIGLPPLTIIRRYRLHEATELIRTQPGLMLARIAAQLKYSDQAPLATDFRQLLGFSPSAYRRESTA
ncbi:helix-turn-helix domain-containing protein [Glutamicibacter ardleyensis]|uniref:helix-turn-helix domain-containing protein n=1 Tax=Glutamicibacter ardleyensis TaxID=225894 RepID=UPI003F965624